MLALAAKGPLWGDLEDQLGVDRNSKSKNEDGYTMGSCLLRRVAVGVQPASTRGALQLVLETLRSGPTPPVYAGGGGGRDSPPPEGNLG